MNLKRSIYQRDNDPIDLSEPYPLRVYDEIVVPFRYHVVSVLVESLAYDPVYDYLFS